MDKKSKEHTEKMGISLSDEANQKDRRRKNIVIRGVPESESEVNEERFAHDIQFLVGEADIQKSDIIRCFRVGSKDPEKRAQRVKNGKSPYRALVCELPTEADVIAQTNGGSGHRFKVGDKEYWINRDLTPAQQLAGFRFRKNKPKKKE